MMGWLISSANIALFIAALTIIEIVLIAWLLRRFVSITDMLPNILAGDFLLLAWYFGTRNWRVAAVALLGALAAHVVDMAGRWRRAGATPPAPRFHTSLRD